MMRKLLPFLLLLIGCNQTKIKPGDHVLNCVVDSIEIKQPASVAEVYQSYVYHTNCNTSVTTNKSDSYHIGDTITYIYRK